MTISTFSFIRTAFLYSIICIYSQLGLSQSVRVELGETNEFKVSFVDQLKDNLFYLQSDGTDHYFRVPVDKAEKGASFCVVKVDESGKVKERIPVYIDAPKNAEKAKFNGWVYFNSSFVVAYSEVIKEGKTKFANIYLQVYSLPNFDNPQTYSIAKIELAGSVMRNFNAQVSPNGEFLSILMDHGVSTDKIRFNTIQLDKNYEVVTALEKHELEISDKYEFYSIRALNSGSMIICLASPLKYNSLTTMAKNHEYLKYIFIERNGDVSIKDVSNSGEEILSFEIEDNENGPIMHLFTCPSEKEESVSYSTIDFKTMEIISKEEIPADWLDPMMTFGFKNYVSSGYESSNSSKKGNMRFSLLQKFEFQGQNISIIEKYALVEIVTKNGGGTTKLRKKIHDDIVIIKSNSEGKITDKQKLDRIILDWYNAASKEVFLKQDNDQLHLIYASAVDIEKGVHENNSKRLDHGFYYSKLNLSTMEITSETIIEHAYYEDKFRYKLDIGNYFETNNSLIMPYFSYKFEKWGFAKVKFE